MTTLKFLPGPAPCRKCELPTVTVRWNGRVPMHVGCDTRPAEPVDRADLQDLLAYLARTLGPLATSPPPPPAQPEHVGPCVRCRRPTRRYGPHARALCHTCDERTAPLVDQPPLFNLGVCRCGHVLAITEENEACPDCLVDPDEPHDCPMSTKRKVRPRRPT